MKEKNERGQEETGSKNISERKNGMKRENRHIELLNNIHSFLVHLNCIGNFKLQCVFLHKSAMCVCIAFTIPFLFIAMRSSCPHVCYALRSLHQWQQTRR